MDSVSLVVEALAAGTQRRSEPDVKEAYRQLRQLVAHRFRGAHRALAVLADHEEDPETYRLPLTKMVRLHGVADDVAVLGAAASLLGLLDPSRSPRLAPEIAGSGGE